MPPRAISLSGLYSELGTTGSGGSAPSTGAATVWPSSSAVGRRTRGVPTAGGASDAGAADAAGAAGDGPVETGAIVAANASSVSGPSGTMYPRL